MPASLLPVRLSAGTGGHSMRKEAHRLLAAGVGALLILVIPARAGAG
jgi:hypothetical protein